ncbi:hypothetical protein A2462_03125 [candidate division WOR-1 bacterium RIFOXYC2_FULL_41_25]|uniref:Glycoside hydrolase family 42 N-terminal domain-containing protein n=1 Tax=candidate division WOR-1 bacterium RIFOXYC2_FULL_41_25 TaxID=1802586 RepID=A0A1F4TPW2_UNCSA|nr:MAG: hypothetical protein A2385_06095 [Bdellovibrionales bacterium RIFOXYB1_FULL_39_21]OFZ41850.1 MAG: hypothetical protein A2485_08065 [Bdellovibrionales bacterium RIFOXYC12_FULL_39_17]OFZ50566.1 MAG: hypothetical protein A2404_05015 [Bdellovibrionales bacterium RIFOXYC1_FULL_39_130]OFZ77789.1 MAG: hypothetical protein A2560_00185 [Bdellovibrionales bacterium RIFOXYD1_FULL_39_84]OFZ93775.1 MAG: hypothetical protein A2504_05730 [Bdellovibrionales bacterium RIFOXYD12_FULL_39_22]OGC34696.1 MA
MVICEGFLQLTTPEFRGDRDYVFPGENHFLYWKTSSSLWNSKLAEYQESNIIIVPINWAFHSDTGENYDFGEHRPEANLAKLVQTAKNNGKEIIFLVAITPSPFLPNGGIPHLLARNISISESNISTAAIDSEGRINKMFSFFDPRLFKNYVKFLEALSGHFSSTGVDVDVWTVTNCYYDQDVLYSYFSDYSNTFTSGLSRFLSIKMQEAEKKGESFQISSQEEEQNLRKEYYDSVYSLYAETAREHLSANWAGHFNMLFLGGRISNIGARAFEVDDVWQYCHDVFRGLCDGIITSSILLPLGVKRGALARILSELVEMTAIPNLLLSGRKTSEEEMAFRQLELFSIYEKDLFSIHSGWSSLHLYKFLSSNYGHTYRRVLVNEQDHPSSTQIHFFTGDLVDEKIFSRILEIFMNGGSVILDTSAMNNEFVQKMELFVLENNLQVERVNFMAIVNNISLGDGRLIYFSGEALASLPSSKILSFWEKIVSTFSLYHCQIVGGDGVECFWRTRPSLAAELSYSEVRRVGLYNPTSYRKKVKLSFMKNFALMKIVDETNAKVVSRQNEIEVDFSPNGSISIDFGVFGD